MYEGTRGLWSASGPKLVRIRRKALFQVTCVKAGRSRSAGVASGLASAATLVKRTAIGQLSNRHLQG